MKYLLTLFSILLFVFQPVFSTGSSVYTVWLDEMDLSNVDQAAGKAQANQSMWKTPLVIAADTFSRGVGTHAFGIMRIKLDGKTESFQALVGVDDSAPEQELKQASVEFVIVGDGNILWRSGVMHAGDKAREVSVSTKGIKSLILKTEHAGDGITGDRADWVNAKFEASGEKPVMIKREKETEYILTPKESGKPQINSPYKYGARPGNPVLFKIPVSGKKPWTITCQNLPKGLSLDKTTGIITGNIKTTGTYTLDITATNQLGSDKKQLTFEIGDKLALTPPMGWNSWNVFGADINDKKIRAMADAMVEHGLINYGYSYINIDDGWQGKRGGKHNAIMPNERFPDMKALVDYVHSKGLKIGIYSSPWVQTFAGYTGGSADTKDGEVNNSSRRYGTYSFAENDVKQWAEWEFDYLKYDWVTNDIEHTSEMTNLLKKSGRDIVYSISNAAPFGLAENWSKLTNARRTTGDIHDSWCSLSTIGFLQDKWQPYAQPGSWNDPDMLIVGKVGWGDGIRTTGLSPDEQYTHMSLWSILAAPLMIGCELTLLDDFTLSLLKNSEVLAVNQDIAGIQGHRVTRDEKNDTEVWAKPLNDGSWAVGLFNLGEKEQTVSIDFSKLNITGNQTVRDLWKHENIGEYNGNFSAIVPVHGVVFVKISNRSQQYTISLGKDTSLDNPTLTIFLPDNPNGKSVIICPGGGYGYLETNKEGAACASWFNEQGITVFVLKYRLPDGNPAVPITDAKQAIRLVRQNASRWKIDPDKVGIMGFSAGGHLASTLATHFDDETRPGFQILFYPVITMDEMFTHPGSRKNLIGKTPDKETVILYSNELQVTPRTPPAFIVLSHDDKIVPSPNSVNYYLSLQKNDIPAEMHIFPTGGHGWGFSDKFIYYSQWTVALQKWLEGR